MGRDRLGDDFPVFGLSERVGGDVLHWEGTRGLPSHGHYDRATEKYLFL